MGALDALVNLDPLLANQVCVADDKVDAVNRQVFQAAMVAISRDLENVESYINLLSVSRYLERIADHATNIAQDVLYLLQGEIVRHRHKSVKGK
jgi:phosphate transport system protein